MYVHQVFLPHRSSSSSIYLLTKLFWKEYLSVISGVEGVLGVGLVLLQHGQGVLLLHDGGVVGLDAGGSVEGLAGGGDVAGCDAALGHPDVALGKRGVELDRHLGVVQGSAVLGEHHVAGGPVAVEGRRVRAEI